MISGTQTFFPRGGYGDRDRRSPPRRNRGPTVRIGVLKKSFFGPYFCLSKVHLRGLPYRATEREIADWLTEAADPVEVSDYGLLGPVDGLVLDLRAFSRL